MADGFFLTLCNKYPLLFLFNFGLQNSFFHLKKNAHHFSSFFCSLSFADFSLPITQQPPQPTQQRSWGFLVFLNVLMRRHLTE
jgi:hypothetical protein